MRGGEGRREGEGVIAGRGGGASLKGHMGDHKRLYSETQRDLLSHAVGP